LSVKSQYLSVLAVLKGNVLGTEVNRIAT